MRLTSVGLAAKIAIGLFQAVAALQLLFAQDGLDPGARQAMEIRDLIEAFAPLYGSKYLAIADRHFRHEAPRRHRLAERA